MPMPMTMPMMMPMSRCWRCWCRDVNVDVDADVAEVECWCRMLNDNANANANAEFIIVIDDGACDYLAHWWWRWWLCWLGLIGCRVPFGQICWAKVNQYVDFGLICWIRFNMLKSDQYSQIGAISGVRNEKREGGRRGNRQKKATQKIGRSTKVRRN